MINLNDIKIIVDAGSKAPSGDNMQPWKCSLVNGVLNIYHVPNKDSSIYNFNEYGSFLAIGAFIENAKIAAIHLGYNVKILYFPSNNEDHVASMEFGDLKIKPSLDSDKIFQAIYERSTNRKPYSKVPPSKEEISHYKQLVEQDTDCQLHIITNSKEKKELSQNLSLNERLLLENSYIHDGLFSIIRWTDREEEVYRTGLNLKTLELNFIQQRMFYLFNDQKILKVLLKLGISKILPLASSKLYESSGALCSITIPDESKKTYVHAGEAFERLWLNLVADGYSSQPTAGIVFLGKRIQHNQTTHLSKEHVKLISQAFINIKNIFRIDDSQQIAITFRFGKSSSASLSRRLPVEDILSTN